MIQIYQSGHTRFISRPSAKFHTPASPRSRTAQVAYTYHRLAMAPSPFSSATTLSDPSLTARHRLVTYGSLGPGGPNHHRLGHIRGRWVRGWIRGNLVQSGWGAAMGYPALIIQDSGPVLEVWVLEADTMEREWEWLDEFEGKEYERVPIPVETLNGVVMAQIYTVAYSSPVRDAS